MWINPEVNLPEALLEAQQAGELVVFAGAGVSVGWPSSLPDFRRLTDQVSAGSLARDTDEPDDRYLGRLEAQGIDVTGRTRSILAAPGSAPTALHRGLLSLFSTRGNVRIVTTNFDPHLSTAAKELFPEGVETYFAPALPLGRDFHGIVYLHGALAKPDRPLVLTDREFGRAYLSDGWATRMLVDMFSRYTVLFVGYSHRDPVMTYLARSLVTGTRPRFAFSSPGEEQERWWSFLGVNPVTFPLRSAGDRYGALTDAISDWGMHAHMGALDHEARIRTLVEYPPPLEQESTSYLEAALHNPIRRRFFLAHARSPEWLDWADQRGLLDRLFTGSVESAHESYEIAQWFANRFAIEHPANALDLVRRKGPDLGWDLWQALARELAFKEPHPVGDVFGAWIAVLCQTAHPRWARPFGGFLLQSCAWPDDRTAALLLFEFLSRPRLKLEQRWPTQSSAHPTVHIAGEIGLASEEYELRTGWDKFFAPHVAELYDVLGPVITGHLNHAHTLLHVLGSATATWDPMSFRRSAIEAHPQDAMPGEFGFLVDAGRDVIEWLVRHRPTEGTALQNQWAAAASPLLRRLSVHALTEHPTLQPDDALQEVERRGWLYAFQLKHEVFRLLERWYPEASARARSRLIRHSMKASAQQDDEDADEREIREYSRYNLAVWLRQIAPDCAATERHFNRLQQSHPEFAPRTHPDLDHWSEGATWGDPTASGAVEEILLLPADEQLKFLTTFRGERHPWAGPKRGGLLEAVREASTRSFEWGWGLALVLERRADWSSDLWEPLLRAWGEGTRTDAEWEMVFGLLERTHRLDSLQEPITHLLEAVLDRRREDFPPAFLVSIERIADRLAAQPDQSNPEANRGDASWLTAAINHPSGRLTLVWLRTLAARRAAAGESWGGLATDYRRRFEGHIRADGYGAEMGRVALASQTLALFSADPEWTRAHLLPLFDWTADVHEAARMWHGFLTWGQWNESLFKEMLPSLIDSFEHADAELAPVADGLVARLAGAALHSATDPLKSGWLLRFVRDASPDIRVRWASRLSFALSDLDPSAAAAAWDRWIEEFWSLRLTGVPRPLSAEERTTMAEWPLSLGEAFPNAVDKVCAAPVPRSEHNTLLYRLRKNDLTARYPTAAARLISHVIAGASRLDYECAFVEEAVRNAAASGADREVLLEICEHMARVSCRNAAALRAFVLSSPEDSGR
ncbi:MAG: hypothetical protein AVDCRST_MAG68-3371 [uncultured Gemmatimonadetes bacterium]|uniref:DUF4020 domain-containing protein n=1 Tax=uncultured Gemmatimonadota bacterium TaxID=203437 RepID=A0A6J4LP19_9BACT|nr:MAG: hypothetical protein AVDCRST_MAG68-3371 [uncultured Gemmatimonadota bacterium]